MSSPVPEAIRVLRDRSTALYIASRFASGTAVKLLHATLLWQVFALTDSTGSLAILGAAQLAPALLLGLYGGALADAHERRRIVQCSQTAAVLGAIGLMILTVTGHADATTVVLLAAAISTADTFERPARIALLPQLVRPEQFPAAVILNSVVTTLSFMTGPVLAGLAIHFWGVSSAYGWYVGLIGVSIALLFGVRSRAVAPRRTRVSWQSIRDGLVFVRGNPIVLGCMTLDMFAVIFGGAVALLPVYAKDILNAGAGGYGILTAGAEIGAVLMALYFLLRRPVERMGSALLWGVAAFGVATVVFGLSRNFTLSLLAFTAVGMADYISVVMRMTLIQTSTPDEMRGRVSAVNMLFISSSNQFGIIESGLVAHYTSPQFAVVSGGIMAIVVVVLVAWRVPSLRRHRRSAQIPVN